MSETDLVLLYTRRLEQAGFTYIITGSVAGVFYGEPRVTHDVDLVLALKQSDTARIAELFPLEEFYCPPEEIIVQEVLRAQRGHFNLIHHERGDASCFRRAHSRGCAPTVDDLQRSGKNLAVGRETGLVAVATKPGFGLKTKDGMARLANV